MNAACMYCGRLAPRASYKEARLCRGCGRAVRTLGGETPWVTLIERAQKFVGGLEEGVFVVRTKKTEEGGLHAAFFWQPRGAEKTEDATFFVNEILTPEEPTKEAFLRGFTFAGMAGYVESHCGGAVHLDEEGALHPIEVTA